MQTTIGMSKSFKKQFKKAKLTIQAQLIPPKVMTDESFIKWLLKNHYPLPPTIPSQKIGEMCVGCAEIIETDKHYCKHGSCYTR